MLGESWFADCAGGSKAFFQESVCGRRDVCLSNLLLLCFLHRRSHLACLHYGLVGFPPPSDASPATVLALEEIKRGLTCFCLQLLSCLAGLLTPIWEEQTREQLCLLLGSAGAA